MIVYVYDIKKKSNLLDDVKELSNIYNDIYIY